MQIAAHEFLRDARGFVDVAAADAKRAIDHRRIVENEGLLGCRRAIGIKHFDFGFEQARSQFARIGNRRGTANELRLPPIKTRDAPQPAQNIAKMAAKNAAIGMQFVQNDVAKILEQARPARVVRQDAGVQHVRVRQNNVAFFANGFTRVSRRVTVVCENAEAIFKPLVQIVEFRKLILRKRFCRKKIERACIGIFQDGVQHR